MSVIRYQIVRKFGRNASVGTSYVPVVSAGAALGFLPDTAAATTVVSTDADDTAAGAGAQTLLVQGVDSTGEYIEENVTLAGLTPVALSNQFLFIHRAIVTAAGASAHNEGELLFKHGSTVIAQVDAQFSQTEIAAFYVGDNTKGITVKQVRAFAAGGQNAGIDIRVYAKNRASGVERVIGIFNMHGQYHPNAIVDLTLGVGIGPGNYLWLEAKTSVGTAEVGCAFDFKFN